MSSSGRRDEGRENTREVTEHSELSPEGSGHLVAHVTFGNVAAGAGYVE
jgi:hypothetical protein